MCECPEQFDIRFSLAAQVCQECKQEIERDAKEHYQDMFGEE